MIRICIGSCLLVYYLITITTNLIILRCSYQQFILIQITTSYCAFISAETVTYTVDTSYPHELHFKLFISIVCVGYHG